MSSTSHSCPHMDPLLTELFQSEPARVLRDLRESDPVHFVPEIGAWVVTRHDLVRRMMSDSHVSNDPRTYQHHRPAPAGSAMRLAQELGMMAAAPDDHARIRRLVLKALTTKAVRRMEGQIHAVVEQYAAPLRGRSGVVDLYGEFFEPIPNTVISRMMGVPALGDDEVRFRGLAKRYLGIIDPLLGEEDTRLLEVAIQELHAWLRRMVEDGRTGLGQGLIADLVAARDLDGKLNDDEIVAVISTIIAAGTDTISEGSVFGLRTLFEHPEEMAKLRADRTLLPKAVDELLRYDFGPGDWMPRYARTDFELEGRTVRKGQLLLLSFTGAHRDPAVFAEPDRLDLERDNRALLMFGHGPHYCLGAGLARSQLAIILEAVLDFLPPGSRLLADRIEWSRTGPLATRLRSLPVEFAPQ